MTLWLGNGTSQRGYGLMPTTVVKLYNAGVTVPGEILPGDPNAPCSQSWNYALTKDQYNQLLSSVNKAYMSATGPLYNALNMNGGINCATWDAYMIQSIGLPAPYPVTSTTNGRWFMTSSLLGMVRLKLSQLLGILAVIIGIWLAVVIDRSGFGIIGVIRRVLVLALYVGSSVIEFRYLKSTPCGGLAPLLASSLVLRFLIAGSVYITIGDRGGLSHLSGGIMLAHVLALFILMAWTFLDDMLAQLRSRR